MFTPACFRLFVELLVAVDLQASSSMQVTISNDLVQGISQVCVCACVCVCVCVLARVASKFRRPFPLHTAAPIQSPAGDLFFPTQGRGGGGPRPAV